MANKQQIVLAARSVKRVRAGLFTNALTELLQQIDPSDHQTTWLSKIAFKLVQMAVDGNIQAIRLVAEYTDGKPTPTFTVAQAYAVLQNAPPEELAAALGMTLEQYMEEEAKYTSEVIDIKGLPGVQENRSE